MVTDTYKTIKNNAEGLFKDKGSKFYSFAFPVESEDQIKTIIKEFKKSYHDARHCCYAYKLGLGEQVFRMNDDGEPSGTAGKPIYGQILSQGLSDILIIVVRYFGGILLGTHGLINAYKSAANNAISNAQIVDKTITCSIDICFSYSLLSHVMHVVKEENLEITKQNMTSDCSLSLKIRLSEADRIKQLFTNIFGVSLVI